MPALELLAFAATELANADVPADIVTGVALACLTALRKPAGGVRGIATGDVFRRLVSRALAKTWTHVFDEATRPFQYALQPRAGTDALAAHVCTVLELRDDAVLVSLDGRNAYDTMSVHPSSLPSKPPRRNWSPSCGYWMDSHRLTAGGTVLFI